MPDNRGYPTGTTRKTAKLAAVQASSVWLDRDATVEKASSLIAEAGAAGADLIAFPENFIPGHPSWFHYGPAGNAKSLASAVKLFDQAVEIPSAAVDALCAAAARARIIVVMGLTEKMPDSAGTMYNTQLFIDSSGQIIGKHQKLVATMTERMVHSPGRAETQRTFSTELGQVSALVCGENSNPLALGMIAAAYPVVHVASWPAHVSPGSPGGVREISEIVSRGTAHMLGCFVVSASGVNSEAMIADIAVTAADEAFLRDENKSGGACIVNPAGQVIAGPMRGGEEGILYAEVDFTSCIRARVVLDIAGHYNRSDVYRLTVDNRPAHLVSTIGPDGTSSPTDTLQKGRSMNPLSIGIIVPPANPTVEPEIRRMLPTEFDTYVTRLPVLQGTLESRLAAYADHLPETAATLAGLGIKSLISACTGCSYSSNAAADRDVAAALSRAVGAPAVTAAGSVLLVLERLAVKSLTIISPYPDWLTDRSAAYWRSAGYTIDEIIKIPGTGLIYDLSSDTVSDILDSALSGTAAAAPGHAILVTGTGAPSLAALDKRAATTRTPLISSNVASVWAALDSAGKRELTASSPSQALRSLEKHIRTMDGR